MSLNHFASDFSQTHWWPQPQQHEMMMMEPLNSKTTTTSSSSPPSFWPNSHHQFFSSTGHPISCSSISGLRFDLNNEEDEETQLTTEEIAMKDHAVVEEEDDDVGLEIVIPKEPLFEKPLTPSDVGKLNRLVIPKQHAEKYFPLNGVSESGEKGLLLSFEDELGKPWRFRYSYWNSSQSYVLTKGWSRFVKEKKLDAGDIVQFERHRHDCDRMFIGWRRRKNVGGGSVHQAAAAAAAGVVVVSSSTGGNGRWQPYPPQTTFHGPAALSLPYPPPASVHAAAAGGGESRTITAASGNCKRLRLFGVNMECQPDDDSVSSNQFPGPGPGPGPGPSPPNYHYYPKLLHANYHHPNHMEVDYPGDISQSRYQQG